MKYNFSNLSLFIWIVLAIYLVFDNFILRPSEPVNFSDKIYLQKELDDIILLTSSYGIWSKKNTIYRQNVVVSAVFSTPGGLQKTKTILVNALEHKAWKNYVTSNNNFHLLASLCKHKYRARIWLVGSDGEVSVSLLVKEFKRDKSCDQPK
jgi:hypothetical protein